MDKGRTREVMVKITGEMREEEEEGKTQEIMSEGTEEMGRGERNSTMKCVSSTH